MIRRPRLERASLLALAALAQACTPHGSKPVPDAGAPRTESRTNPATVADAGASKGRPNRQSAGAHTCQVGPPRVVARVGDVVPPQRFLRHTRALALAFGDLGGLVGWSSDDERVGLSFLDAEGTPGEATVAREVRGARTLVSVLPVGRSFLLLTQYGGLGIPGSRGVNGYLASAGQANALDAVLAQPLNTASVLRFDGDNEVGLLFRRPGEDWPLHRVIFDGARGRVSTMETSVSAPPAAGDARMLVTYGDRWAAFFSGHTAPENRVVTSAGRSTVLPDVAGYTTSLATSTDAEGFDIAFTETKLGEKQERRHVARVSWTGALGSVRRLERGAQPPGALGDTVLPRLVLRERTLTLVREDVAGNEVGARLVVGQNLDLIVDDDGTPWGGDFQVAWSGSKFLAAYLASEAKGWAVTLRSIDCGAPQ